MYAIVKTGGKQYKVAPGSIIEVEKLDADQGATVELEVIAVVDGDSVEADPAKAGATKVTATVLEQFKGEKQLVFKFKKRKNYKRTKGHRQQLTRIQIDAVGANKAEKPAKKAAAKKDKAEKPESKPAAKKDAPKDAKPAEEPAKQADQAVEEVAEEATQAEAAAEEAVETAEDAATEAAEAAEEAAEATAEATEE